jgi:hypothetical protein
VRTPENGQKLRRRSTRCDRLWCSGWEAERAAAQAKISSLEEELRQVHDAKQAIATDLEIERRNAVTMQETLTAQIEAAKAADQERRRRGLGQRLLSAWRGA